MKIHKISCTKGNIFKTANPQVVNKYRKRQLNASYYPIKITRVHKNIK